MFGVCDPLNELEYGECVFQPTLFDEVQLGEFQAAQEVMVVRNPCYYPGDIRVLKLVKDKPQYAHLNDCIVFPTKGPRPHADESSGGDLDGDEFFVSWDQELIPRWRFAPFDYSPSSPLDVIPDVIKDVIKKVLQVTHTAVFYSKDFWSITSSQSEHEAKVCNHAKHGKHSTGAKRGQNAICASYD